MAKASMPAALGMLAFAIYHAVQGQQVKPRMEPPIAPPRSPYREGVAGAGIIEARTENISIGSHLPGVVEKVLVKVDDEVQEGDALFSLDERHLQAEKDYR